MVPYLLLLPLITQARASSNDDDVCPHGWTDATELGMGCLYLIQERLDWESARVRCGLLQPPQYGVHLVVIDNPEQLAFLRQGLNFADGTKWITSHYWWTAASDRASEGIWTWGDSEHAVQDFLSIWSAG